jgi:hypothetical protein
MAAFRAPEEPHLALICCPQLAEPPEGKIVLALRAFDLDGGHGFDFIVFIIHNSDLVLRTLLLGLHLVSCFNLTNIPAFPALKLTGRRDHHRLTFRTEHRYSMREQRRLTLVSETPGSHTGIKGPHYIVSIDGFITIAGKRVSLQNPFFGKE